MEKEKCHAKDLRTRACVGAAAIVALCCVTAPAAPDIVYVKSARTGAQLDTAVLYTARHLGLLLDTASVFGPGGIAPRPKPPVVVVAADAIEQDTDDRLRQQVRRLAPVAVLVAGVSCGTNASALSRWSGGGVVSVKPVQSAAGDGAIEAVGDTAFVRELAGIRLPLWGHTVGAALQVSPLAASTVVLLRLSPSGNGGAVLTQSSVAGTPVFVASSITATGDNARLTALYRHENFIELAPLVIVLRGVLGSRCLRSPRSLANLTIDDPMLTEPYGYLSFAALIDNMRTARFHTTIAFIPWNFARFDAEVVALFSRNRDLLSLCVHGNDHDGQEFATRQAGNAAAREQIERKVRQALARMGELSRRTGLSWDTVFVFPHKIATVDVLERLRAFNYLATVNAMNVPAGTLPDDPRDALRSVSTAYAGFASVRRFTAKTALEREDTARAAIDLFLGNPVLRYTHHGFFASSDSAFNPMARMINGLQPAVIWADLGAVARSLYRTADVDDSTVRVESYSRSIDLHNDAGRRRMFAIELINLPPLPIASVSRDGKAVPYDTAGGTVRTDAWLDAGVTVRIAVAFQFPARMDTVSIARRGRNNWASRAGAEVRDRLIPLVPGGQWVVRLYYSESGSAVRWAGSAGAVIAAVVVVFMLRRRRRRGTGGKP